MRINRAGQATGIPEWKATLFAGYEGANWGVNIQERWRSWLRQDPDPTLTFRPARAFEWFLSINNLLDQGPPIYVSDDLVGRYFTSGGRVRF